MILTQDRLHSQVGARHVLLSALYLYVFNEWSNALISAFLYKNYNINNNIKYNKKVYTAESKVLNSEEEH